MSKATVLASALICATHTTMIRAAVHDEVRRECKKLGAKSANNKFIQQKMQGKRRVY